MKTTKISWKKFDKLVKNVVDEFNEIFKDLKFDIIITPNRGGLIFTGAFQYMRNSNIPVIVLNKSENYKSPIDLTRFKRVLVLDDINDTSKTLYQIVKVNDISHNFFYRPLIERYTADFKTPCPNFIKNDKYILFPWDYK